jgi:hypothetical protein
MAILVGRLSAHNLLMSQMEDFSVTHIHPRSLADPFRFHACAERVPLPLSICVPSVG